MTELSSVSPKCHIGIPLRTPWGPRLDAVSPLEPPFRRRTTGISGSEGERGVKSRGEGGIQRGMNTGDSIFFGVCLRRVSSVSAEGRDQRRKRGFEGRFEVRIEHPSDAPEASYRKCDFAGA